MFLEIRFRLWNICGIWVCMSGKVRNCWAVMGASFSVLFSRVTAMKRRPNYLEVSQKVSVHLLVRCSLLCRAKEVKRKISNIIWMKRTWRKVGGHSRTRPTKHTCYRRTCWKFGQHFLVHLGTPHIHVPYIIPICDIYFLCEQLLKAVLKMCEKWVTRCSF